MWPFRKKQILDPETADWHIENFEWLIEQFNENDAFIEAELVLPRENYFKTEGEKGHKLALTIFEQVKFYCGMDGWNVELHPDDNPLARSQPMAVAMVEAKKHALGTFEADENTVRITYAADLVVNPIALIATFAHELAHYLLATAKEKPVCDDDEEEFLTDLAATFLGFGVFLANSRFEYETVSDGAMHGWRMGHSGYLPEADIIFDLALFIKTKSIDPADARACLKPHMRKMLDRALIQIVEMGAAKRLQAAMERRDRP